MTTEDIQDPVPSWGSINNFVTLGGPVVSPEIDRLADRQLISETVSRYAWAFDERRKDVLTACFTETVTFAGSVAGNLDVGPFEGRATVVEWLAAFWDTQVEQRRHCVLNVVVEDLTASSANALGFLLLTAAENGAVRVVTTGFYRLRMAKQDGAWRIDHFFAGFDAGF